MTNPRPNQSLNSQLPFSFSLLFLPLLMSVLLFSNVSWALEHWHIPQSDDIQSIQVTNINSEAEVVWISGPIRKLADNPEDPLELQIEIPSQGSYQLKPEDWQNYPWIHIKTRSQKIIVSLKSKQNQISILQSGWTNRWSLGTDRLPKHKDETQKIQIFISNLAPFHQTAKVVNSKNQLIKQIELSAFTTKKVEFDLPFPFEELFLEGDARINGIIQSADKMLSLKREPTSTTILPNLEKTYFLLSNPSRQQSFVVGMTDTELIKQARYQIENPSEKQGPWLPRILVAEIDYTSNQENRDLIRPGAPLWSWHISTVFNFAHLGHQDCDGSPEMIEELLMPWNQGKKTICFWSYEVIAEIKASTLSQPSKHPARMFLRP